MTTSMKIAIVVLLSFAGFGASAQTRVQRWRGTQDPQSGPGMVRKVGPAALPAGVRVVHDVRYGAQPSETFDVYAPAGARAAPVVFMVHGGAWWIGDKAARGVVRNKVAHWVPRGIVVVSVDYPMLPGTPPLQQAQFVAKALAAAQRDAPQWGGDPHAFVLMGHSAGAHLVSLISAEPSMATSQGAVPWLGTVALDSAAYNVATIMRARHLRLYDDAFGDDPAAWAAVSPAVQLQAKIAPFLAVCSSRRADSCPQADAFVAKARDLGARAQVLPEALRHAEINEDLGQPSAYTSAVDGFLASLDPALAALLR
ncbi:MAG: alpha/beta hydrolase [Xanthomonadales bacterium]|nr:alpha/beta hydrolase [Xanthomonadales bacterium]ODU93549.1 MAG: esterase [Rhodanobacter sp. SCN 66-43]OJY86646.1 MAG: esterase [Xanthomonadales bacterium 66-474]